MKEVKIILAILAISLFFSNYYICNYFYYVDGVLDANGWWGLKSNIYAVIIALTFLSANVGEKGIIRFIFSIGVGLAIANVIDKCYFDVIEFTKSDIIMIVATVLISAFDYYKTQKHNKAL